MKNIKMSYQIILIMCLILNVAAYARRARIVGGEPALIQEYPYLVTLRRATDNSLQCGGSIISKKHVLTAAHCMVDLEEGLLIYAGTSSSRNTSGLNYEIKSYKIHPEYNGTYEGLFRNDIAIIKIKGQFVFNEYQRAANLPTKDVYGGEHGHISGWGKTQYAYLTTSESLRKASMTILTYENCLGMLPFEILPDQFCALEAVGIGPCIGDSGGPLIVDGVIVGIASFVLPCATGVPDIYTNIYSYLDFIRKTIRSKKFYNCCMS